MNTTPWLPGLKKDGPIFQRRNWLAVALENFICGLWLLIFCSALALISIGHYILTALTSQNLKLAFDISLHGLEPGNLLGAAKAAKFSSFGFYGTFLHCDTRPGRRWFSKEGKKRWSGLVA